MDVTSVVVAGESRPLHATRGSEEVLGAHLEAVGHLFERVEGGALASAFKLADVGSIKTCGGGKFLLADADKLAVVLERGRKKGNLSALTKTIVFTDGCHGL